MKQHLTVCLVALSILLAACGQLEGDALSFRTADPHLSVGFRLLPAPPVPTPDDPVVPPTATVTLVPTVTSTPEPCLIKGNLSSAGEKIFHIPGSAAYDQTVIDPAKGEEWLCSEAEAIEKGYRKSAR